MKTSIDGIIIHLSCSGTKKSSGYIAPCITMRRDSPFYEEGEWGDEDNPCMLNAYSCWPHERIVQDLKKKVSKNLEAIDSNYAMQITVEFESVGEMNRKLPGIKKRLTAWTEKHFQLIL